jgi:hypothetical protein
MTRTINTIWAAAAAGAVSLVLVASAGAGTYKATQCDSTYGVGAPDAQSFDQTAGNRYREDDWCFGEGTGGGLLAHHPADAGATGGGTAGGWTFTPPDGARFTAIELLASGALGAGGDYFPELYALPPIPAPNYGNPPSPTFAVADGPERLYQWNPGMPGGGTGFTLQMRCPRDPSAPSCGTGDGNFINVRRINFTIADGVVPQLTNAGSSLATQSSQRGMLSASYAASDVGAGIRTVTAEVNGTQAGAASQSCSVTSGRAVRLRPCLGTPEQPVSGSIPLDTTQAPWQQGLNTTRFCAVEYADSGAASTCLPGPTVRVDNLCPVNGTQGVVGFEQLRFAGRKAGDGVTTYGPGVKLTGRAVDGADNPVLGAQLCLGERVDLGPDNPYTPESIVRMVTTSAKGRFAIGLPSGPSRVFRLAQWQTGGNVVEQFATLQVKAKPRLAVRPKGKIREGKKTRLRVNVNRPFAPGQTVEIQARAPTGFVGLPGCSGQVDADGRFTCRDRIPRTPGEAAYALQYRAVVPHVEGSAYLAGTSKVITKRVKG